MELFGLLFAILVALIRPKVGLALEHLALRQQLAIYLFLVLSPDRRRIVHFGITANPSARWSARQIVEAYPFDTAPKYLVRDNDGIYGEGFRKRIEGLGIEDTPISVRSPWQNPYVERLIGTIRRELLDHVIVLNEAHLERLLTDFLRYYHEARPHMALDDNAPIPREVEPPERGKVVATPYLGGLHHRYSRAA